MGPWQNPWNHTHLVLGPDSATRGRDGRLDGHVESASDGRANVKSKRDIGVTDASRQGPGRGEVTN